jgi:hypothetical protein
MLRVDRVEPIAESKRIGGEENEGAKKKKQIQITYGSQFPAHVLDKYIARMRGWHSLKIN